MRQTVLAALLFFAATTTWAVDSMLPLPWQELHYEASKSGLRVETSMQLEVLPAAQAALLTNDDIDPIAVPPEGVLHLAVQLRTARARGDLDIWLDGADFSVLQRQRYTQGRSSRVIAHRAGRLAAIRQRREPGFFGYTTPSDWPVSSALHIDYPASAVAPILAPESLLLLAAQAPLYAAGDEVECVVLADKQLYRVQLRALESTLLDLDYRLLSDGDEQRISGPLTVLPIKVITQLLGKEAEKEAFELLELGGNISILLDTARRLPVQISSHDRRTGKLDIRLRAAHL